MRRFRPSYCSYFHPGEYFHSGLSKSLQFAAFRNDTTDNTNKFLFYLVKISPSEYLVKPTSSLRHSSFMALQISCLVLLSHIIPHLASSHQQHLCRLYSERPAFFCLNQINSMNKLGFRENREKYVTLRVRGGASEVLVEEDGGHDDGEDGGFSEEVSSKNVGKAQQILGIHPC